MRFRTGLPLLAALTAVLPCRATELTLVTGVEPDGRPGPAWLDAIRVFHDEADIESLSSSSRPLTPPETEWQTLIMVHVQRWPAALAALQSPFADTEPPATVVIVLGNQGGNDAFSPGPATIAFDLQRMSALYGSAGDPANADRLDRFFAHEFTHVMHKAWQRQRGFEPATPLESALWESAKEGIGNYRSLSPRWRDADGNLTAHARSTLARLEPVFVERYEALAHATEAEADELREGLSLGPFEDKWGALPVALWLVRETRDGESALVDWVARGPWAVLDLARKNLAPELASRLPRRPDL